MFLKELDNQDEIVSNKYNMPNTIKHLICLIKKVFCILTIKENGICVLPYKHIENKLIINIITKIIAKNAKSVVLSNYLNELENVKFSLIKKEVYIYNGKILSNYLIYNFIEYISKLKNEEIYMQEIFVLVNNCDTLNKNNIIYLAKKLKRVNIVTNKINEFNKIGSSIEKKLGIGMTVTSNKRKSLAKAKIIVNIDFNEEMLNQFNINRDALILNINNKIQIKSKLFNGINVYDYNINYDKKMDNDLYKSFNKKMLYESIIIGKNYNEIIEQINDDKVKITNLIGKNGTININEYRRN